MGRNKTSNKKQNKSGRFQPHVIRKIERLGILLRMNFSQTLEYLIDLGLKSFIEKNKEKMDLSSLDAPVEDTTRLSDLS